MTALRIPLGGKGPNIASVKEVASHARMTGQTVAYHFGAKEMLRKNPLLISGTTYRYHGLRHDGPA